MPATKRKPAAKTHKPKKARARKPGPGRHADAYCKGECRVRTKGMKVGDRRRRVSKDGKKLVITRVG